MSEHENNDCLFCFAYVQLLLILLSYSIATHEILFFQKQWNTFYKRHMKLLPNIILKHNPHFEKNILQNFKHFFLPFEISFFVMHALTLFLRIGFRCAFSTVDTLWTKVSK